MRENLRDVIITLKKNPRRQSHVRGTTPMIRDVRLIVIVLTLLVITPGRGWWHW
jgi:hypothetical protein